MATIGELLELASQYHRAGDFLRAEQFYRQILQAVPTHADALHLLGILAHQTDRSPAAISFIQQAIGLDSLNGDFHFDLARVYQDQKQLNDAAFHYRQALRINPNHVPASNNLGNVLNELGHVGEAIECYRQAIRIDPDYAAAHYNLGNVFVREKQIAEAILCYRQVLRINPNHAAAHYNLGNALATQGNSGEAIECYLKVLHLNCNHRDARFNLGNAYCERGQTVEAETCYRDVLRISPNHAETHNNLGNALKAQGKLKEAALSFQEALRLKPDNPEILYNLGNCLQEQGEIDQAIICYRQALCQRPDYADGSNNLAKALKEKGLLGEALVQVRHTLELQNDHAQAYSNLSEFVAAGYTQFRPEEVANITAFLTSESGSTLDRSLFSFAMATLAHHRGAYDEAFQFYRQANDLTRQLFQESNKAFDSGKHRRLVDQIIETYKRAYFDRVKGWGIDTEVPVFIVGMPRSGSTLVEQILASHARVFGAGELGAMPGFSSKLADQTRAGNESTPMAADPSAVRELANDYLRLLKQIGGEATRVINKTLDNFLHLGVIATLFPRARIVHCRRDPLDTCVSCYFQNFKSLNFTSSLEDIGAYYRSYDKLMAHWSQALPLPIHEVCYEELVTDPKAVIRDLLDYCGLDWDERCLMFFENPRLVQTASSVQVRTPIFTQAIGRWRHYRAHLGPLLSALGYSIQMGACDGRSAAAEGRT